MLNQPREYLVVSSPIASFLVFVSWFCIIGSYEGCCFLGSATLYSAEVYRTEKNLLPQSSE
jgi:hypothetical protein